MSEIGAGIDLGKGFLLAEDGSLPPLRMSDLLQFLSGAGRNQKCPHCNWVGGWEIAMHEEDPTETNPRLDIFMMPNLAGNGITTAAMTCPNCGHFSQVATYKIRQFLSGLMGGSNE